MCMEAVETAMDRHFAKMNDKKKKRKRTRESAETCNFEELSLDDNDDKEKSSGEESFSRDSGSNSDE